MLRERVVKSQLQGVHTILLVEQQLNLDFPRIHIQIYRRLLTALLFSLKFPRQVRHLIVNRTFDPFLLSLLPLSIVDLDLLLFSFFFLPIVF